MIGIYWDTSTEWIVVEVFEFHSVVEDIMVADFFKVLYSYKASRPKDASTQLVYEIRKAMTEAGVAKPDWIFVAMGPGSFTGIRISVATARNLSQLWEIPCQGIDTMQLYRWYYKKRNPKRDVITVLDGKSDRYFVGIHDMTYDWTSQELDEELTILQSTSQDILIYSHTPIDWEHQLFATDYPGITGIPLSYYWNLSFLEKDLEEFHYETLLPKYMRESYATKSIPEN